METLRFLLTSSFYPPYHIGGDAMHVKYLAGELVKRGHEVHVMYSLDAYHIKKRQITERGSTEGIYVHTIKTWLNLSAYEAYVFGNSPTIIRTFERLVKQIRPDVVHHHNISLLGYGILKKKTNYMSLYTAHDYWLICQQNDLLKYDFKICEYGPCFLCALFRGRPVQLWRYRREFKEIIENEIDYLIAPSEFLKRKILEKFKVNAVTIPNFVSEPPSRIEHSGFTDYFIYAGVLERHKGIMVLLKAFKEIADKVDTKLLIVGDGTLRASIAKFVRKYKLNNKIILLGCVAHNRLLSLLKSAKALIIPSIWPENCPLIVLEAISLGTLVIVSNKGGLPEIINKVDRSLIYNSGPELKQILMNFNEGKYSSQEIKKIYTTYYSPQVYLKSYFKLIT